MFFIALTLAAAAALVPANDQVCEPTPPTENPSSEDTAVGLALGLNDDRESINQVGRILSEFTRDAAKNGGDTVIVPYYVGADCVFADPQE